MKPVFCQLLTLLMLSVTLSFGQEAAVFSSDNQAIRGYDPVAYFTENKPVKGNPNYSYTHKETNWLFASAANRDAFKADPDRYMPQYGGYCAYGLSQGHKAPTDPEAWTIVDDKLYLNYNPKVKTKWVQRQADNIQQADQNWPKLKNAKE
ncbi:YHS domain-containing (seleno)protein [Spirosoma spitsbergense]|uniref:YHS domain-containing (seleno)protein n=1 Tax=Spirosoma spitsbergense TaxID=431554 RepID=UPI00039D7079|nr:YHS domain-containing (seleno)protein [Spirosoma spitsbergense]